jgi:predicted lipoprotein with Yx(FWY)xxD motif
MRRMPFLAVVATGALALLVLAAVSAASVATRESKTVVVSTRNISGLGQVLVNAKGLTLYMFVPDKQSKVTCVKSCAEAWPPLVLPKGAKATASGKAQASLLGSDANPSGGHVVTYNGWPLYTYVADSKPGADSGQALKLNGGLWYVLSPAGKVIKTKVKS